MFHVNPISPVKWVITCFPIKVNMCDKLKKIPRGKQKHTENDYFFLHAPNLQEHTKLHALCVTCDLNPTVQKGLTGVDSVGGGRHRRIHRVQGVDVSHSPGSRGGQGVRRHLAAGRIHLHGRGRHVGSQLTQVGRRGVVQLTTSQTLHGCGLEGGPCRVGGGGVGGHIGWVQAMGVQRQVLVGIAVLMERTCCHLYREQSTNTVIMTFTQIIQSCCTCCTILQTGYEQSIHILHTHMHAGAHTHTHTHIYIYTHTHTHTPVQGEKYKHCYPDTGYTVLLLLLCNSANRLWTEYTHT